MSALDQHTANPLKLYTSCGEDLNEFQDASDSSIWVAFKAGNQRAFEIMFTRHYELLLNYGLKFNQCEDDVKDYIQVLFNRLWESRTRLGANNSIKSYLLASLRRMILRGSKSKLRFLSIHNVVPTFSMNLTVENRFFKDERERTQVEYLAKLIQKLPKRQKEAIFLKYYGDHKFNEIAEIMGISTRVVYKLIYKAVGNLSTQIAEKRLTMEQLLGR